MQITSNNVKKQILNVFFWCILYGKWTGMVVYINMRDIVPKQGGGEAQTLARIMS